MPIYEYQGKSYDIDSTNPDEAKSKILKHLESQKVESKMPTPVEGSGGAAFGIYRPQGRRPESQQGREASKDMPLQTARGVVTGTLGAIPDLLNLPGTVYSGLSGNEAPYKVPFGSEEWNQMLPFQSDTPQARLARFGGEVLAPIPTIKGVKAIARAPGQVYRSGQEFTQGAMEGLRNPTYQRNSQTAFAPLEQTYYPTPQVQAFQNAPVASRPSMLSQLEASQQPSSSLFNSPTELVATALGPKTAQGQNLIPYQGQTTKAFGETVGRDIATEPYKRAGLPSLAGATLGGIFGGPLGAVAGLGAGAALNPLIRGAELYALNKLGKTAGFLPGFPEQLAQAQGMAGRAGLEASIPKTPLLPAPSGPVRPTQTMYVNPEGVATTNIQGTQTNYTPRPTSSGNFGTVRYQNQTAAQQSQQMAAQKLQEIQAKQQPQQVLSPEQLQKGNDILAQIRARNAAGGSNQPGQMISTPPTQGPFAQVETPVAGPVNPSSFDPAIEALPNDRFSFADKLALQRANLQNNPPPAMTAADEADMAKQTSGKELKDATKQQARDIINDYMAGGKSGTGELAINEMNQTRSIDLGAIADNKDNVLLGMAKRVVKAGYDSVPEIPGMSHEQVIRIMYNELTGKKAGPKTKGYEPGTTQASTSSLQEALNKVKTKNETKTTNARPENVSKEDWAAINEPAPKRSAYDPTDPVGEKQKALESFEHTKKIKEIKEKNNLPLSSRTEMDIDMFVDSIKQQLKDPVKLIEDEIGKVKNQITNIKKQGITPKDDYDGILAKLEQRLSDAQKTLSSKTPPKNVSQMMVGEPKATGPLEQSLVSKRSFNGDLQKYRYGTEKSPLTLEEYNHLKNSEFIDKQNTRDIIMGMRPELTEYSIWYKDKSGKIQNIQTYGNEFKKK